MITIKSSKFEYFVHIIRNESYSELYLIMQEKTAGKRVRAHSRTSWFTNVSEYFGLNTSSLFLAAVSKTRTEIMMSSFVRGWLTKKNIMFIDTVKISESNNRG